MIENERKYLLDVNPKEYFKYLKERVDSKSYEITQGYLSGHSRIRHLVDCSSKQEKYIFTYKKKIEESIIEIETDISQYDFSKLWTKVSDIIYKTRFKIPFEGNIWEIDFFKKPNSDKIYLVMAEVELPEDIIEPKSIPDFIQEHLFYIVPLNDPKFKNKKLEDVEYVNKLIKKIKRK